MHHGGLPRPTVASASGGWIVSLRLENCAAMSATFWAGWPPQGASSDAIAAGDRAQLSIDQQRDRRCRASARWLTALHAHAEMAGGWGTTCALPPPAFLLSGACGGL